MQPDRLRDKRKSDLLETSSRLKKRARANPQRAENSQYGEVSEQACEI